jgi:hypothetical protein
MELDWTIERARDVSLVEVRLRNPAPVARRVRVSNRLDGPVLPPRTHGVPERGWDDGGCETAVPARGRVALGYACRAPSRDPPVELDWTVAVDAEPQAAETPTGAPGASNVADAVRRLGSATPPRDALPAAEIPGAPPDAGESSPREPPEAAPSALRPTSADVPSAVESWLDAVERRIESAERLTEPSVSDAADAMAMLGGLDGVAALEEGVDADARTLRAFAERARELAERGDEAAIPVDAMRRVA